MIPQLANIDKDYLKQFYNYFQIEKHTVDKIVSQPADQICQQSVSKLQIAKKQKIIIGQQTVSKFNSELGYGLSPEAKEKFKNYAFEIEK